MRLLWLVAALAGCAYYGKDGGRCYHNHTCDEGFVCVWGWKDDTMNDIDGVCLSFNEVHVNEFRYRAPESFDCECPDAGAATRRGWR